MARRILIGIVIALWAFPAFAVNEGHYPSTLVDTNCTDSFDTPAAGQKGARPSVQISGTADGFCDHDSRIIAAPITVDTIFGPFRRELDKPSIILYVDADAVLPLATSTWQIRIVEYKPHDNVFRPIHNPGSQATEGDKILVVGPAGFDDIGAMTNNVVANLPDPFYINLDLVAATSWDGSISWRQF